MIETIRTRPPVQYVLVRRDLPVMIQCVHVGHACGEAVRTAPIDRRTILRLLHVASEAELRQYASTLDRKGFAFALIVEDEGPYAGQATALATEPSDVRVSALGKLFYHLGRAEELPDEAG